MPCFVACLKHDSLPVFVPGIARKAGSPVRCQDSRILTGSHNMLKCRFIDWAVFSVFLVCVLSCTCASFAGFVAIGFLQASRCSSFGVLALKKGIHFQGMTTSNIQVLHVYSRGSWLQKCQETPRFHAAEAGVAGLEGMESVGPAMAAAAFLLGSSVKRPFLTPQVS